MSKNEVTKAAAKDVAVVDETLLAALSSGNALTDLGKDDIAIPFLAVLQPLSPQLIKGGPDYIEGAEPGMIFNSVTKQLFLSVDVIVADYRRSFIEWVPRTKGGGFRGEHGLDHEAIFNAKRDPKTGRAVLESGNELVDTRTFYALVLNPEGFSEPVAISMASTQTKVARQWINLIQTYIPAGAPRKQYDPWAAVYRLGTAAMQNEKGRWHVFSVKRLGLNTSIDSVGEAQAFRQQLRSGVINVDRTAEAGVAGDENSETM